MRYSLIWALVPTIQAFAAPFAEPAAFAEAFALQHGSEYANTMGEIAILYPSDREWSENSETVAPCGSYSSIGNRSEFPLDDGFVALVAKSNKAWSISLKISYDENPTKNSDFDEWASGNVSNSIDIGHTCFYMPDQPSSINAGDYATIQLEYMALEDDSNETHYACADIVFVEESVFKVSEYALSCFNATDNDYYSYSDYGDESSTEAVETTTVTASASTSSTSTSSTSTSTSSGAAVAATVLKAASTGLGLKNLVRGVTTSIKKPIIISNNRSFHTSPIVKTYEEEKVILDELSGSLTDDDISRLGRVRNIGISAHIDSGKTTFTERVLYYTGRIKAIHDVRGRDGVGAKMDHMDLEREKGITIQSAATYCSWDKDNQPFHFNLIDTPGHIDFTIEVERALRVLDGAVLVVCAVSGVQSQTVTVDRQMKRYNVPRITFVNKMDRMGANPWKAIEQINTKLKMAAAAIQVPIGAEKDLSGVINIIDRQSIYFEGSQGEKLRIEKEIPSDLVDLVEEKRALLIEMLADVDDEIAECFLEEIEPTIEQIKGAIRRATIARKFTPVLMGSALANRGIQPVLDSVVDYLPNPSEILNTALNVGKEEAPVNLIPAASEPSVALAFKLEEGKYGQLTYLRVYQGKLKKGSMITHVKSGKKIKIARLVRMHSNDMEDTDEICAGEICATFGIDCASGDTFTDGSVDYSMTSMFVPDAVVSLSIAPQTKDAANFSKAVNRFQKEDPTFRVHYDADSKETIISGMGELHLEIYVERMKREYNVECTVGRPRVSYRESINGRSAFDYTHKKQSGGAGQFAKVMGYLESTELAEEGEIAVIPGEDIKFRNHFQTKVVGGKISEKFLMACQKGFEDSCEKGPLTGSRVLGVHMVVDDGATHVVDSSEMAFKTATQYAFKQAFMKSNPVILEPIMNVVITAPMEFQGNIISLVNKLMGIINDTENNADDFTMTCDCSLNNLFGIASSLRAVTQGKGEFTMEFKEYQPCPPQLQKQLIDDYQKKSKEKA
ncbi:hypothetical protein CANARDRAFT_8507 [[Candida] arabinofermentans NRRL YB-2248]|uniref:Elongation factor G, mitochondrial n=1 Tax=[Candida] arabinofermentans NRRL YB-2248 TaxID=983967 RepID=A0A1E4SYI8_9ASCO|nr:hypothetical protein CANARDRAFT_8507 [[Candida] arabinofermentans NRRL YB-2248]